MRFVSLSDNSLINKLFDFIWNYCNSLFFLYNSFLNSSSANISINELIFNFINFVDRRKSEKMKIKMQIPPKTDPIIEKIRGIRNKGIISVTLI